MQQALIIYDNNKKVVAILYGVDEVPDGVQGFIQTLRDGETITGDVVSFAKSDCLRVETDGGIDFTEVEELRSEMSEQRKLIEDIITVVSDMIGGAAGAE